MIKFRLRDKKEKYLLPDSGNCAIFPNGQLYCTNGNVFPQDFVIVEQWTGDFDKNGKEIYVGDICLFNGRLDKKDHVFDEVKFGGGGFYFPKLIQGHTLSSHTRNCEVVGNIHDNSELIN